MKLWDQVAIHEQNTKRDTKGFPVPSSHMQCHQWVPT